MSSILFLIAFAFYLVGLSGTVPSYRDSGDLIASIHTLGIAHPPGYALYILIGKLFVTLLPFGNVAYRVNVLSAFFAALSVALLFKVLYCFVSQGPTGDHLKMKGLAALTVAVLYATSPAVMALSRVAEMYTLSAFLAAAILGLLFSERPNNVGEAALLLGLGLSVHPTLIFLAPLFALPKRREFRSPVLYFLLGLTVFLYLPIRAAQHPLLNWGDPSSWRNFWRVVMRADYGGLKLHPSESLFTWTPQSIWEQLQFFALSLKSEWGWAATLLGVTGAYAMLRDPATRRRAVLVLMAWLLSGPGFFLLSNLPVNEPTTSPILQPYLLLVGVLWAPFVLAGLLVVTRGRFSQVLLPAMAALLLVSRPWHWTSERNDYYAYDYARNLLKSLPANAVLYDPDDTTHFSVEVLQTVENRRTDVVLLNFFRTRWGYEQIKRRWPDLLPPIPIENGQELQRILWSYSAQVRPFYGDLPQKLPVPYKSEGLAYAAVSNPKEASPVQPPDRAESLLQVYVQRGDYVTDHHSDFFTRHLVSDYAAAHCNLGLEYANHKEWSKAIDHYRLALAIDPMLAAAYNDWGIVEFEHADYSQAAELFQKGLVIEPTNEMLQKNAQLALQKMRKLI